MTQSGVAAPSTKGGNRPAKSSQGRRGPDQDVSGNIRRPARCDAACPMELSEPVRRIDGSSSGPFQPFRRVRDSRFGKLKWKIKMFRREPHPCKLSIRYSIGGSAVTGNASRSFCNAVTHSLHFLCSNGQRISVTYDEQRFT